MIARHGAGPLVDAINNLVQAKRERQQEEQIRQMLTMIRAGKRPESAFGGTDTGPTGIAGILDRLNPLAPHRGTTGLEELYAQKDIESRFTSPFGKPPWHRDPEYRETEAGKVAAGLEPRAGRERPERTEQDILKEIVTIYKQSLPEGSAEGQIQAMRLTELKNELAELQGMKIVETPSPAKKSWMPFGWGDVSEGAGPPVEELVPKTRGVKKVPPGLKALAKRKFEPEKAAPIKPKAKKRAKITFETSAKAQSAPDMRLDSIWAKLSAKQKKAIWENEDKIRAALDNGYSVEEVLGTLGVK